MTTTASSPIPAVDVTVAPEHGPGTAWRLGAAPVRLVAHRGAPRVRRENTLPAVASATALAADAVEVGVRRTVDGIAVLLHDETLGRMWGDGRAVADVPWCEVARLGNGLDRIPRLDAVLDRLDGAGETLVVDLADPADALVAARTVVASTSDVRVAWCGAPEAMRSVRAVLPDADVWLAWESLVPPTVADLSELAPSTLNLDVAFLTRDVVDAAHAIGLDVSVWTVDDPDLAVWAAGTGVDSITTNDVPNLRAALERAERDGGSRVEHLTEAEVAARAEFLAHRVAAEVVAFTREHPVGVVATKAHEADLVTDVDRMVEQIVRGRVRAAFPTHGFTGEEYGVALGDGHHHWYLDPVDGTTNLANGLPWTSMSLCLTRNGRPIVGVVADPWRGEVLEARRGGGARIRDRRLRLDAEEPVALAGAVVGTELDGHRPWDGFVPFLEALADRSCTLRVMGSGTLTLAQVAAGRGVGACVPSFDPIDHGAAVLLVHEAGGVVATPDGPVVGFPPVGSPVLVAHPAVADELHGVWREALRSAPSSDVL